MGRLIGRCALACAAALALPTASAQAAPPPNDRFSQEQELGEAAAIGAGGFNAEATVEAGEPAHAGVAGGKSVWYRLILSENAEVTFTTCTATFDTLLAVYTGASVSELTPVVSNDTDPQLVGIVCHPGASRVRFTASAGVVYHVAVDGSGGAAGTLTLGGAVTYLRPPPPPPPPPPLPPPPPPAPACPPAGRDVGATYRGSHDGGGSVCFTVSRDFSELLSFLATDVGADTCTFTFAERRFPQFGLPIDERRFDFSDRDGTLNGGFPTDRGAAGSFRIVGAGPPLCASPTLGWTATTDATPPWVPDTTAPALTLQATATQRALRTGTIVVRAKCALQACSATASGTVRSGDLAPRMRLAGATRAIARDGSARMTLRLPATTRRYVQRSLAARRTVRARVTVRASDAAGNAKTRRITIRIRR